VRGGAVSALAFERDDETVHCCHEGAESYPYLPRADLLPEASRMEPYDCIHGRVFHDAVVDHCLGALNVFLGGLKDKFYCSCKLVPVGKKQFCSSKGHGGMGIVPARMHQPAFRCEGKARLFLDGKGVAVRPYAEHFSGKGSLDDGSHSPSSNFFPYIPDSHFLQFLYNKSGSFRSFQSQFRDFVEMSPPCGYLFRHGSRFFKNTLHFFASVHTEMVYFQLLYLMPPGYALFSRYEVGYTCSGMKRSEKDGSSTRERTLSGNEEPLDFFR